MAGTKLYLNPLGLIYGASAGAAIADGMALPLAGGTIAFAAAELIEGVPGSATRQRLTVPQLLASRDAGLGALIGRVVAPRPPFAGLSLDRPRLMGIVNVTPDSFSDGGLYDTTEGAVMHAAELAAAGADIVDVGGESTRPGADPVEAADELARIGPVIAGLAGLHAVISVDTRKADVARAAAKAGAKIFNDVSALTYDTDSLAAAAATGLCVVLMHAKGEPMTMQDNPAYDDVVLEVFDYLAARIETAVAAGIDRSRIAADPGLGFGKTLAHNLALLGHTALFHGLGVPLLIGASRKRFISLGQGKDPRAREAGSFAAAIAAAGRGAQIFRVHEVAGTAQALAVWRAGAAGREV